MNSEDPNYILNCTVANIALLTVVGNNKLLDSDFYNNMDWPWGNDGNNTRIIKEILEQVGCGNPAMMIMQFYALLVMPKQLTPDYNDFCKGDFNSLFHELKSEANSTYEQGEEKIDYYRHVRNAVSHSHFSFYVADNEKYVKFWDKDNKGNTFDTVITFGKAAIVLEHLLGKMMAYLCIHSENA